jgi:GT2 family glycosyltransferase
LNTDIAVIIITWNSSRLISKVLDALEAQTLKPKRVLVIDNGSEDAETTASLVKNYGFAEWLPLASNTGFAAANNEGIRQCEDVELIALLNPDAFPEPQWLAVLVDAAHRYPDSGSFASRLLIDDTPHLLDGAGDSFSIFGKPRRRGHGTLAEGSFITTEPIFCPSAAAALYRRSALIEAGCFDDQYFCYVEDIDLGFRLRLMGYNALYIPTAVVFHIGSATTGGQHSDFSVYFGHRNLVWTYVKNMPGLLLWLLMPLHLLLNLISIIYFVFRGQGRVIFRAKIDALKGLGQILQERKKIQTNRVVNTYRIWQLLEKCFRVNCQS